jgi:hypothetical protein
MNEEYNGWTNYETWLLDLWLTNEIDYYGVIPYIKEKYDAAECATGLKAWVYSELERLNVEASLWSDLLNASLSKVNWRKIIEKNY